LNTSHILWVIAANISNKHL